MGDEAKFTKAYIFCPYCLPGGVVCYNISIN